MPTRSILLTALTTTLLTVLLFSPIPADAGTPPAHSEEIQQIQEARAASNAALQHQDLQALAATLGRDAHLTVSSGALVSGKAAQIAAYQAQFERFPDAVYERAPTSIRISGALNRPATASERGTWVGTWTSPEGRVEQRGEYMAMWRKGEDGWLIRSELFVVLEEVVQEEAVLEEVQAAPEPLAVEPTAVEPTPAEPPPAPAPPPPEPAPPPAKKDPPRRSARCNTLDTLDSNGDGRVSAVDRYWRFLDVWIDRGDGVLEESEIVSLYDQKVREVGLSLSTFATQKKGLGEIRLDGAVILDLGQDGFGASSRRGDGLLTIDLDGVRSAGGATFFDQDGKELSGRQVIRPGWSVQTEEGLVALTCP